MHLDRTGDCIYLVLEERKHIARPLPKVNQEAFPPADGAFLGSASNPVENYDSTKVEVMQ